MNPNETHYDAADDQNQGVISTMAKNNESHDTELVSTRIPRLDPNIVTSQSGAAIDDGDEEYEDITVAEDEDTATEGDEAYEDLTEVEEETDLTDHDHHQDDNYSLGGHVTRSGGV